MPREYMTDTEIKLKRKLIALLRDDGNGHHHAKYAERLERFDIQIVPLNADPMFTAAISFDRGIIFIGEGFLNDPSTFYQLNVLLRHELAHNLLMHQVRMANKLGEATHVHTSLSASLHQLQNIIADDEISNRKYSDEDKIIVRNMTLNGKTIGGLVTEDHRKGWLNLSIEEMFDRLSEEIAEVKEKLLAGLSLEDIADEMPDDIINRNVLNTYSIYSDTTGESMITGSLEDLVKNDFKVRGKQLRPELRTVVEAIYNALKGEAMTDEKCKALMRKITVSSVVEKVDLFDDGKVELYTPEEKYIAIETLKKFKSEFTLWYEKVLYEMGLTSLTAEQLEQLLDIVK